METAITSHQTADRDELLVHNWRVERLTGLGIPGTLAEACADHLDWHQVARLVQRGCPRSWPCASSSDERTRELGWGRCRPRADPAPVLPGLALLVNTRTR